MPIPRLPSSPPPAAQQPVRSDYHGQTTGDAVKGGLGGGKGGVTGGDVLRGNKDVFEDSKKLPIDDLLL